MIAQGWDVGAVVTNNAQQLCSSLTHPGITLAQDCILVLLCAPDQFVGQGRHRHQLANYGLSGARHCLDIEQVDCEVAVSFARHHEGNIRVHFGSCPNGRHVMEARSACKLFILRLSSHANFPDDLYALSSDMFWQECEDAEALIKLLTVASFRLQRDQITMADVVMNYGAIFLAFYNHPENALLVPCIENRWHDCEQPLFILALFLHPRHRSTFNKIIDKTPLTSLG